MAAYCEHAECKRDCWRARAPRSTLQGAQEADTPSASLPESARGETATHARPHPCTRGPLQGRSRSSRSWAA
eukprot:scaffold64273_cov72-Phaeocystis_antarctica.AAC.3